MDTITREPAPTAGAESCTPCGGETGGHCSSTLRGHAGAGTGAGAGAADGAASPEAPIDHASRHIVVVGGGSAAFAAASTAAKRGARVTMINDGLPIGGCCVNVGCVPSKALLRAAGAVHHAQTASARFDGVETTGTVSDFGAVMAHARDLVARLRQDKYVDVAAGIPGLEVIKGFASFTGNGLEVRVGKRLVMPDRVIVATGSTTFVPPIAGLSEAGYLTHESAFQLTEQPASLVVLGGRYVALELAQLFARLGTSVTVLQRSARLIPDQDEDVSNALTEALRNEGITVHTAVSVQSVSRDPDGGAVLTCVVGGSPLTVTAAKVLVATGRRANTARLGLPGLKLATSRGWVVVDDHLATSVPHVFAAGDVLGDRMFVYTAAQEGQVAATNAMADEPCCFARPPSSPLPWVMFTEPQVAGVGIDEVTAAAHSVVVDGWVCPLSAVPRALAARETRGFIKLVRRRENHVLVGARIVAAEGSELLMHIATAIQAGMTSDAVAAMLHPYLTLSEGIKLACLGFDTDVKKLSCCAT